MPIDKTVNRLSSTSHWQNVAFVAGGYAFAMVLGNVVERFAGMDIPNELYGVGSIAAGTYYGGSDGRYMAAGGGVYVLDSVAQRVGVKNAVTQLGA